MGADTPHARVARYVAAMDSGRFPAQPDNIHSIRGGGVNVELRLSDLRAVMAEPPHAAATVHRLEAHNRELCARLEAQHQEIKRLRYALNREWVEGGSLSAKEALDRG